MFTETEQKKIEIFKDLFKGRNEIFAKRWEKADKSVSGYTPVCLNEWKKGICIKLNRKKCKNCHKQEYPTLSEEYIVKHLKGYETYGVYPFEDQWLFLEDVEKVPIQLLDHTYDTFNQESKKYSNSRKDQNITKNIIC